MSVQVMVWFVAGGDCEPETDVVHNIPYTLILIAGVLGSLLFLIVLGNWCGWNS